MLKQKTHIVARIVATTVLLALVASLSTMTVVAIAATLSQPEDRPSTVETTAVLDTEVEQPTEIKTLIDVPLAFPELEYTDLNDADNLLAKIDTGINKLKAALKTNDYTPEAYSLMEQELERLCEMKNTIKSDVAEQEAEIEHAYNSVTSKPTTTTVDAPKGEYYYATKTWEYFKNKGYSDAVVSGIIGNMMIETSGGTLNLQPHIYDAAGAYYGLCQWSLYYRPNVAGMAFEDQLDYLYSDIASQFSTFGFCYSDNFGYEDFLSITDPGEAAIAFAAVYERCASGSYDMRASAAYTVYNYFT